MTPNLYQIRRAHTGAGWTDVRTDDFDEVETAARELFDPASPGTQVVLVRNTFNDSVSCLVAEPWGTQWAAHKWSVRVTSYEQFYGQPYEGD